MAGEEASTTDVVHELMTTPPGEFVAERNRVAKALRADGERDAAKLVAALRKPSVGDWAFNVLAGTHADEVIAFADAANAVQDAQAAAIEGRDAGDIRELMKTLRERTSGVVSVAREVCAQPGVPVAGSSVGELTARLAEIAGSQAATELLRNGLLGAGDPGSADPFEGLELPVRSLPRRDRAKSAPAARASKKKPAPRADDEEAARAAESEAAERRARVRALADAERAQKRAAKALERSESEVERLAVVVEKAQTVVDDAVAKLDAAHAQLDAAEGRHREAADTEAAASATVTDAQQAVDADR